MIQLIFSNPSSLKYKTTPLVEREVRKSLLKYLALSSDKQ